MSKENNNKKHNPEDILKDVERILDIFNFIDKGDITKINTSQLKKRILNLGEEISKKYKINLDTEE